MYSEFRPRKKIPRISETASIFPLPSLTLLYSQTHIFCYTRHPTAQVKTVIALGRYKIAKP
jgi:hypothetical protein